MTIEDLLIWWLSQCDCEAITESYKEAELEGELPEGIPQYIKKEYWSRYGRAGRGRLWVPTHLDVLDPVVEPWPETALGIYLKHHCGGIVFEKKDLTHLKCLPGIITNFKLERYE